MPAGNVVGSLLRKYGSPLSTGVSYTLLSNVNIAEEGNLCTFTLTINNYSSALGGTYSFVVVLSGYTSAGDFSATSGTFSVSSNTTTFTITPSSDVNAENNDTFYVVVYDPNGVPISSSLPIRAADAGRAAVGQSLFVGGIGSDYLGEWTAPAGVTQIHVALIAGGGGGCSSGVNGNAGCGGGLTHTGATPITVVPGAKYSIQAGRGGRGSVPGQNGYIDEFNVIQSGGEIGGDSWFISLGYMAARGGPGGSSTAGIAGSPNSGNGGPSGTLAGAGGVGGIFTGSGSSKGSGGGAAAGYAGNSGASGGRSSGNSAGTVPGAIAGGGGGGGGAITSLTNLGTAGGAGGGGTGILGLSTAGATGTNGTGVAGTPGGGGSGGTAGKSENAGIGGDGGIYGGGGGSPASISYAGGNGGPGAVRIMWQGFGGVARAYPSTNTGNL